MLGKNLNYNIYNSKTTGMKTIITITCVAIWKSCSYFRFASLVSFTYKNTTVNCFKLNHLDAQRAECWISEPSITNRSLNVHFSVAAFTFSSQSLLFSSLFVAAITSFSSSLIYRFHLYWFSSDSKQNKAVKQIC